MEVNLDFLLAAFHKASAQSKFVVFLNNMEMLKMYTSQLVSSTFMSHLYDSSISYSQIPIYGYCIINRAIRKCDKQYDYNNSFLSDIEQTKSIQSN